MVREILVYPHKTLREASQKVEVFDSKLHALLDDMYETMIASNGIGLAAIQVGVPLQVLLINLADENGLQNKEDLFEIINPEIISKNGKTVYFCKEV